MAPVIPITLGDPIAANQLRAGPGNKVVSSETSRDNVWAIIGYNKGGGTGAGVAGIADKVWGVVGSSNTSSGVHGTSQSWDGVHGETQSSQHAGVSGINNGGGAGVYGSSNAATGVYGTSQSWDGVHGETQSSQHAGVSGINNGGGAGIYGQSSGNAGYFAGNVTVTGTVTVQYPGDIVLGGADCAEEFCHSDTACPDPGSVVIAGEVLGQVCACHLPYDRRVVGVVSGAGAYRPAIVLDRQPGASERLQVAVLGKVYCKTDANYGAIKVGDLLTTSPTSGHAMRAADPAQGFGAILGKALGPLEIGRGLVPMLVLLG